MTHNTEREAREKAAIALYPTLLIADRPWGELDPGKKGHIRSKANLAISTYLASLPGDDVVREIRKRHEYDEATLSRFAVIGHCGPQAHQDRATLLARDTAHTARIAELMVDRDRLREALHLLVKQRDHKAGSIEGAMSLWEDARAALNTGGGE